MWGGGLTTNLYPPPYGGAGVGALLQAWRAQALLTQEQLAERAGLSVRTVRRLETGAAVRPHGFTLRRLIEALHLGPAHLEELAAAARAQPVGGERAEPTRSPSPARGEPPARAGMPVLRQLPAAPPLFTGRSLELSELERAHDMSSVVIATIDGMAGIGKTALALHAAHRLSGAYSDGQLFLDLHGYTQGVDPVQPGEALDRLLRALGVAAEQIPAHTDDRAALYRSRLADRKILVVLDNAAGEAQVRPLLPGTPGSLALVTSRRRLVELDHTLTVSLDVLPHPDAVALFARSAGVDADDAGVDDVVELCGRLPLALQIAAARLRSRPTWGAGHLLERLRDRQERLGELELGERSVTAALDMSYLQLGPELQRAYRLCGPLPESSFDVYVAAALVDVTVGRAERLLDDLLDVNLLQELVPGRYAFHDLVRSHATAAAVREEPDRMAAFGRMFDYYSHTASVAMNVLYPCERERRPPTPPAGTPTPGFPGPGEAAAWLDLELTNLLTAARYAAQFCPRSHPVHLSTTLDRYLRMRDRYAEAEVLHQQALTVARRNGDAAGEADVLTSLGHLDRRRGRTSLAADRYRSALAIARSAGNRRAEVDALLGLGFLVSLQGDHAAAVEHIRRALAISRRIAHRSGETDALYRLGWLHLTQGEPDAPDGSDPGTRYERAAGFFEQAHALARATGNSLGELHALLGRAWVHRVLGRHGPAEDTYLEGLRLAERLSNVNGVFEALDGTGRLDSAAGRFEQALAHHSRALELATDLGQPIDQARSHDGIARAHHALGRRGEARRHWQAALDILSDLGTGITVDEEFGTAEIRARLDDCDA
jgi:tetratricopeptide (TPR) repeat protein/transcriptional regulator with XRE-family HTH domain